MLVLREMEETYNYGRGLMVADNFSLSIWKNERTNEKQQAAIVAYNLTAVWSNFLEGLIMTMTKGMNSILH